MRGGRDWWQVTSGTRGRQALDTAPWWQGNAWKWSQVFDGAALPHIERCNNTLRQRVSRLVRDALSFSKKLANHIGTITLFICHDNLTRAAA